MLKRRGWYDPVSEPQQKEWRKAQAQAQRQTQIQNAQTKTESLHAIFKLNSFLEGLDLDIGDGRSKTQVSDVPGEQDQTTKRVNDVLGSFSDFLDLYEREGLSRLVGIQLPGTKAPPVTKRIPLEKDDPLVVMKAMVASLSPQSPRVRRQTSSRRHGSSGRHVHTYTKSAAARVEEWAREQAETQAARAAESPPDLDENIIPTEPCMPHGAPIQLLDEIEEAGPQSLSDSAAAVRQVTLIPLSPDADGEPDQLGKSSPVAMVTAAPAPGEDEGEVVLAECFGEDVNFSEMFDSTCVNEIVSMLDDCDFNHAFNNAAALQHSGSSFSDVIRDQPPPSPLLPSSSTVPGTATAPSELSPSRNDCAKHARAESDAHALPHALPSSSPSPSHSHSPLPSISPACVRTASGSAQQSQQGVTTSEQRLKCDDSLLNLSLDPNCSRRSRSRFVSNVDAAIDSLQQSDCQAQDPPATPTLKSSSPARDEAQLTQPQSTSDLIPTVKVATSQIISRRSSSQQASAAGRVGNSETRRSIEMHRANSGSAPHTFLHADLALSDNSSASSRSSSPSSSSLFDSSSSSSSSDGDDDVESFGRSRKQRKAPRRPSVNLTVNPVQVAGSNTSDYNVLLSQPAAHLTNSLVVATPSISFNPPHAAPFTSDGAGTGAGAGLLSICTGSDNRAVLALPQPELDCSFSPSPSTPAAPAQDWSFGSLMKAVQVQKQNDPPAIEQVETTNKPTARSKKPVPRSPQRDDQLNRKSVDAQLQPISSEKSAPAAAFTSTITATTNTPASPAPSKLVSPKATPQIRKLTSEQNKPASAQLPHESELEQQQQQLSLPHEKACVSMVIKATTKDTASQQGVIAEDTARNANANANASSLSDASAKNATAASAARSGGASATTNKPNSLATIAKDAKAASSPKNLKKEQRNEAALIQQQQKAAQSCKSPSVTSKSSKVPTASTAGKNCEPVADNSTSQSPAPVPGKKTPKVKQDGSSTLDDTIKQTLQSLVSSTSNPSRDQQDNELINSSVKQAEKKQASTVPAPTDRKVEVKLKLTHKQLAVVSKATLPSVILGDKSKQQVHVKEAAPVSTKNDKTDLSAIDKKKALLPSAIRLKTTDSEKREKNDSLFAPDIPVKIKRKIERSNEKSVEMTPSNKSGKSNFNSNNSSSSKELSSTTQSPAKITIADSKLAENLTKKETTNAKANATPESKSSKEAKNSPASISSKPTSKEGPNSKADVSETRTGAKTDGAGAIKRLKLTLKERIENIEKQERLKETKPVDPKSRSRSSSISSCVPPQPTHLDAAQSSIKSAAPVQHASPVAKRQLDPTADGPKADIKSRSRSSSASSRSTSSSSSLSLSPSPAKRANVTKEPPHVQTVRQKLIVSFPIQVYDTVIRKRMLEMEAASPSDEVTRPRKRKNDDKTLANDRHDQQQQCNQYRQAQQRNSIAIAITSTTPPNGTPSTDSSSDTSIPIDDSRPAVPQKMLSPEYYYCEARRLKHEADLSKKSSFLRTVTYLRATVLYCRCVCSMEHYHTSTVDNSVNLCRDTLPLIAHVKRMLCHQKRKLAADNAESSSFGRTLTVLNVACLRLEAALCLQMYTQKQPEIMRLRCALDEYQKQIRLAPPSMPPPSPPGMGDCEYTFDGPSDRARASHPAGTSGSTFAAAKAAPFGASSNSSHEEELNRRLSTYFKRACYDEPPPSANFSQMPGNSNVSNTSSAGASSSSFGSISMSASSGYFSTSPLAHAACASNSNVVTVPVAIQTMLDKYLYWSNFLVEAHQFWEEAERHCHDLRAACRNLVSKSETELLCGAAVFETLALQTPLINVLEYISRIVTQLENSSTDDSHGRQTGRLDRQPVYSTHYQGHHQHQHQQQHLQQRQHHHNFLRQREPYRDPNVLSTKQPRRKYECA